MNGAPKHHRALQLAAFHCTHPDLDSGDSALLAYLALNADFAAGTNARPGNVNTADMMKLQPRATIDRLNKNIGRGLIERTETGNGRSTASAYRLCLESPYYPDRTPGGEELTEVCSSNCTLNPESVQPKPDKCAVAMQEVCSQEPESVQPGLQHTINPPEDTPPPPPPPTHSQNGGGGVSSQEQATIDAKYLTDKCPKLAFGKETELAALIQEHTEPVVNLALYRCNKESFDNVKNPVAVVFSYRLPKMIAEVKAEQDADIAKRALRAEIDAGVAEQVRELDRKSREVSERIEREKAEVAAGWKAFENSGNIEDLF
jgi:hypothetical protein